MKQVEQLRRLNLVTEYCVIVKAPRKLHESVTKAPRKLHERSTKVLRKLLKKKLRRIGKSHLRIIITPTKYPKMFDHFLLTETSMPQLLPFQTNNRNNNNSINNNIINNNQINQLKQRLTEMIKEPRSLTITTNKSVTFWTPRNQEQPIQSIP